MLNEHFKPSDEPQNAYYYVLINKNKNRLIKKK